MTDEIYQGSFVICSMNSERKKILCETSSKEFLWNEEVSGSSQQRARRERILDEFL